MEWNFRGMETQVQPTGVPVRRRPKRGGRLIKIGLAAIILVLLGYLTLFLLVLPQRPDYPLFQNTDHPLVIAHRGGASIAPENTLVAFERAMQLGVDMIELDVQISRDGHLVVIHNETVDLTTDGEGLVTELTLAQLQSLDAAYHFQDIRGHYIYRNQGITIPALEEVFQQFPQARLLIDVKVPSEKGEEKEEVLPREVLEGKSVEKLLAEKLWNLIDQYGFHEQVAVASLNDQFIQQFQMVSEGKIPVIAGQQEATRFVFLNKLFLDRLYRPRADVLALPAAYNIINLQGQRLIDGAHRFNMPILYWTINEEETIRTLIERGADGIVTDRPDLMIRILNEMEEFNGHN